MATDHQMSYEMNDPRRNYWKEVYEELVKLNGK